MILSDVTIKELISLKKIIILPDFDIKDIRPVGVRLHLGTEILIPRPNQTIELEGHADIQYEKVLLGEKGFVLKPNQFILAASYESFQVPRDIVCYLDGRSTLARLGLLVHATATTIDGNFDEPRTVVFEIKNIGFFDLVLKPKVAIAMLTFAQLSTPIEQSSQEQYRAQKGVTGPNMKVQKQ